LKVTTNIRIYGPRWGRKSSIDHALMRNVYGGEKIDEPLLNELYNKAKIVLNASRVHGSSGLNMRFFEVLGSGSLLLTDQAPELKLHFKPNTHLIVFETLLELNQKILYFLQNDAKRVEVSLSGHTWVRIELTYMNLVEKLEHELRPIGH
jgi:spore maturation protein CgeB